MYKKFFRATILVFAFLFLSMSFNSFNIKAEEELPNEVYDNAGFGEKMNYWAIVNYGADFISNKDIVIDIQREAIANEEVKFIVVVENEYSGNELTYFERDVSPNFASKINYTLKNTAYSRKYITVLLLRELAYNPTDNLIVDKIIIEITQKRNIERLTSEDILLLPGVDPNIESLYPYDVDITLNDPTSEGGSFDDYVLKNATYRLISDEDSLTMNAIADGSNKFYFTAYRNGIYEVVVEDVFGFKQRNEIEITNIRDPSIEIRVTPEEGISFDKLTNKEGYSVYVQVVYPASESNPTEHILTSGELKTLKYTNLEGYTQNPDIKENMFFNATNNGLYVIYAETHNGSVSEYLLQIDNIDTEKPFVQALSTTNVYTETLNNFDPYKEVFTYDNRSPGEKIEIDVTYYTVIMNGPQALIDDVLTKDINEARNYLYTVRDLIVRYKVTDEAGNFVEKDCHVHSIDNTKPTIDYTYDRMLLYINDPYPTADELKREYGIIANDNSLYENSGREMSYSMNFSELPVDEFNRLNKLGEYNIYLRAVDEAGNESDFIVLKAEVRQRRIRLEADDNLYIVYGDTMIPLTYHCVTRDGDDVPCSEELLEGDSINGELYVLNAHYVDRYEIHYDNIRIPSDLYYLETPTEKTYFEIKQRTILVKADDKEKDYLDDDPLLTYQIVDVCSVYVEEYKDYRCSLLEGDTFGGEIERYKGEPNAGVGIWYDEKSWSASEAVWFDGDGNILTRKITQGTLDVLELFNGGKDNYNIVFIDGNFKINPKLVLVYIEDASKIYGERDPEFTLRECVGRYPLDGETPEYCMAEVGIQLTRLVEGEIVMSDARGNYIDYYEIGGERTNLNYEVEFFNAYLTIERRDISISVVGDLDASNNPTGKYTIYYEQALPNIEVYDSSTSSTSGLAYLEDLRDSSIILVNDKFYYGAAEIYLEEDLIVDYVSGIGLYTIKKGSIKIVDKDDFDAENNYNITFNEGQLEVIKKKIWIKILENLKKTYGDDDYYFSEEYLETNYPDESHIILEANGRFVIEITATTLPGEDPYIPRDNAKMKYHLKREEGINAASYSISIELLEGCENYEVNLYEEYYFVIERRDMQIQIYDSTVIYKDIPSPFTYNEELAKASLQYNDSLSGTPTVEPYKNVGTYKIGIGTIKVINEYEEDVSFNYNFIVQDGTLLVVQREITIVVDEGQSKEYGNFDPTITFSVYHEGVLEELESDEYEGKLGREDGEVPGLTYEVNMGSLKIKPNGKDVDENPLGNYLIVGFDNANRFSITKRTIVVQARNVEAMYGNEYSERIVYDTLGSKLAYNLALELEGYPIWDKLKGELEILGTVDGVGNYVISAANIRIVRDSTGEDVTDRFYNFTYTNGTLTIKPREIWITPDDGQSKIYGESDGEDGITYTFTPELLDPNDRWEGKLERIPKEVNGKMVSEDAGEYIIGLGSIRIISPNGKENYDPKMSGTKTYVIHKRTLSVKADDLTIYYGDLFELSYTIDEIDGLAKNEELGIDDKLRGELILKDPNTGEIITSRNPGNGTYRIEGDNLVLDNKHNYNYTFVPGLLIVNKKFISVSLDESKLSKIYGEEDPDIIPILREPIPYIGKLVREPGENAQKYLISFEEGFSFGSNYDWGFDKTYYFEIKKREITVQAENSWKIFGTENKVLRCLINQETSSGCAIVKGNLVNEDTIAGYFTREEGEEVGIYAINNNNQTLLYNSQNYELEVVPGVFEIKYAEFTEIIIESLTKNPYQNKGEEEEVRVYARFNDGADETNIGDVEWKIVKTLGNGEQSNWEFSKDNINNIVSFTPSGSVGVYTVSASYQGITGYYEVVIEDSIVGNIFIYWNSGATEQVLGLEEEISYYVVVPKDTNPDATVQWLVNDTMITANKVSNIYFFYTPNMGKGDYKVEAKIGNKISEPLYFKVLNNNPPVITLGGDKVVYVEALKEKYTEPPIGGENGTKVIDDIDGDITLTALVISGTVNENVKGTYYIRYDATDSHGNKAISVYRPVVVRDTTAPVVTLIGDREVKLLYGQKFDDPGAFALDNYDGELEVEIESTLDVTKVGVHTITYAARDKAGNRGTVTRYVEIIDNISPLITMKGENPFYVEVFDEFKDPGADVHDNVDGDFIIAASSFFYGDERVASIDTSRLGTYYARYDYKDSAGNVGVGQMRTVIVRDTTAPVITLKGTNPYIIRYSYPEINYEEPGAIALDNYDGEVPVKITGELGNELGTYYLYYDAIDSNGNPAERVTRQVIVVDIKNPIIHFYDRCPQFITLEALRDKYDKNCDVPGYGLWVEDDYIEDLEGLQQRVVVKGTVDDTTVGTYIITYDVTDMAGNAAIQFSRHVKVVDTTRPVIELIGGTEQTVEVFEKFEDLGAIVTDTYDSYHGIEIEVLVNHNVNVDKLGTYTVTYNAKDSNGNAAYPVVRTVYVKDTTPPVITLRGDAEITLERGEFLYQDPGATAIDNYDGPIDEKDIIPLNVPTGMKRGEYKIIFRAIDSSGNIGEAYRMVYVIDTKPPIVLGVEDGEYYKEPVSISFIPTPETDEVLTGWLNGVEIESGYIVDQEGYYHLIVVDDFDNVTEIEFWIDTTPPEILGVRHGEYTNKEEVKVYSNEPLKRFEYRYQSGEWITLEGVQEVVFKLEGTYWVRAVDMADNMSRSAVQFTIDRTPPIYTLTGVMNKGITNTDVHLTSEEGTSVVVNAHYTLPTLYTFTEDGYYQVVIRDKANNTVNLQFVINKSNKITVDNKIISFITQHNAIDKVSIVGKTYPRNSGYMLVKPLIEGGFEYITGKHFSETDYQNLINGKAVEFDVASTDDTYMFAAFVVNSEELNKFGTLTVDDDKDKDNNVWTYAGIFLIILIIIAGFFIIFLKRRKKQEDEEEEVDETIVDDY